MSGVEWWNNRKAWERIKVCDALGWSSHLAFVPASEEYLTSSEMIELEAVDEIVLFQTDKENDHA